MSHTLEAEVTPPLPREGQGGKVAFPSFYLAPVSYYARLAQYGGGFVVDGDEPYRKQTLRNRCYIASPTGPMALTVPVVKFVPYRTPMRDIRISDHGRWRHLHWTALQSSYGRTPFFEYLADDLAPFYEQRWEFLFDYNQALQERVCDLLDLSQPRPARPRPMPYYQLFGDRQGFMPDLSIVDLLFNMGPESIYYLHDPKLLDSPQYSLNTPMAPVASEE